MSVATTSAPQPYVGSSTPLLNGGDQQFLLRELKNIQSAISSTQAMTPQSAVAQPRKVPFTARSPASQDGQIRLARYPWWPVSGQAADAWVYYDEPSSTWRYLSAAPTNTGP